MRVPNMTLNAFKAREVPNNPTFLKQRQRIYAAMLKAGLAE